MGDFREGMREARAQLHEEMSVPAVYFEAPYDPLTSVVKPITVRVHDKFLALGDLKGTNFNYAEIQSISPKIVFWLSEVDPERDYIVSVEPGLAYRVDNPHEHDDLTVTADVVRLPKDKTIGFPLPGEM